MNLELKAEIKNLKKDINKIKYRDVSKIIIKKYIENTKDKLWPN